MPCSSHLPVSTAKVTWLYDASHQRMSAFPETWVWTQLWVLIWKSHKSLTLLLSGGGAISFPLGSEPLLVTSSQTIENNIRYLWSFWGWLSRSHAVTVWFSETLLCGPLVPVEEAPLPWSWKGQVQAPSSTVPSDAVFQPPQLRSDIWVKKSAWRAILQPSYSSHHLVESPQMRNRYHTAEKNHPYSAFSNHSAKRIREDTK